MIYALKQKLEIMESFHCSSSSFDALNSFQPRRNSGVLLIAENEPIQSPTFKSLQKVESKRGSRIFDRKRSLTTDSSFSFSQQLLPISDHNRNKSLVSKSTSILPSIKQGNLIKNQDNCLIFIPSFFTTNFFAKK